MTSLIGILLHASPAELSDLAKRWGTEADGPVDSSVGGLFGVITNQATLRAFLRRLSPDERRLLAFVCLQRRGEVGTARLMGSFFDEKGSLVDASARRSVESLVKAGLLHSGPSGAIAVPSDLLPFLRRMVLHPQTGIRECTTAGRSLSTAHERFEKPARPPLALMSAPASMLAGGATILEQIPLACAAAASSSPRKATKRARKTGYRSDGCVETAAREWLPLRRAKLAWECAWGLVLLVKSEDRVLMNDRALDRWLVLGPTEQAKAIFEVWLSKREASASPPSAVQPFKARQLLKHGMRDACEGKWYSLVSLVKNICRGGLNVAFRRSNIRRAKVEAADRVLSELIDLHLLGCLDLGLDVAGHPVSFRLTAMGADLIASQRSKHEPAGAGMGHAGSASG